jgi:hypothetical protein
MTNRIPKTLCTIALALGLIFAGLVGTSPAHASASTDCAPGQSVDASGCYPTPDCQLTASGLSDAQATIADQRQQLDHLAATADRRLQKIQRERRIIRHLRAELVAEQATS